MIDARELFGTTDVDAFMAYYDKTCDAAYRLACCLTGDATAAEEAVIRAYVRAYDCVLVPERQGPALILALVRDELADAVAHLRAAQRPQLEAS